MERIAIFSDIHANFTALKAVLEDIEKRNVDKIMCLGDIVFKGVSPAETIDIIKEKCDVVLKGNCDEFVADNPQEEKYWTRMKIGNERAKYLKELPVFHEFYLSGYLIRLFHASPNSLDEIYNPMYSNKNSKKRNHEIDNPETMFTNTSFLGKDSNAKIPDIVGYGHIHTPNIVRFKNKTLFNPGSLGMPTEMLNTSKINEDSKFSVVASYIILEGEYESTSLSSIGITLVRVPYCIETEIERIKKSDNPSKNEIIRKLRTAEP